MKLHAGSLYKNYLVLRGENQTPHIIKVDDRDTQWDIYCNEVEFFPSTKVNGLADVTFNDKTYSFSYWVTDNPMKFLGFSK